MKAAASLALSATLAVASATSVAQTPAPAAAAAAVTTPSGLVYLVIKEGTGPSPTATDTVKVHYRGTFLDGREFDSSYKRGTAIEFPLNGVIKCWTEGVQRMKVGGKAQLTCPPGLAYGERGAGASVPPNATLQFEVELVGIAGR
jgi:FKBP-type peptidyl-prolyl cis-trans isomerase FkpA